MNVTVTDYEVIPALFYFNARQNRRVSFYGAAPHGDGWEVKQFGYTIRWQDGTIGLTYQAMMNKALDRTSREAIEEIAKAAAARGFTGWNQD
jgi:hypothetical protein